MADWKDFATDFANTRVLTYSGTTLCDNYKNPLSRCKDERQVLRLYKNCVDWALLERYPTKDELLQFTSKEVLADNGIFIDTEFNGERIDDHICCVFMNCRGSISTGLNVEKAIIPMLYLSEGSDLEISVDDGLVGPIPVQLYYNSKARCKDTNRLEVQDFNNKTKVDNVGFATKSEEPDFTGLEDL